MKDTSWIGLNEKIRLKWILRKSVKVNSLIWHWTEFNGEML